MSDFYVKKNFAAGLETIVTATVGTDIPNLSQIQTLVAGSVFKYEAVQVHEHSNFDTATGGLPIIDGYQTVAGDRVLLSGQTDPIDNGIYIAAAGAWSRSADMATGDTVKSYSTRYVINTADGLIHEMALQASADVTVDTDAQVWVHTRVVSNDAFNILR